MSIRRKEDYSSSPSPSPSASALQRYAHSQAFGVSNKTSWFGSLMGSVAKLDISRNSTRLVDVSEPEHEIGVKYKNDADGNPKETYKSFNLDDTYGGVGPLLMKNFLEAVQKHTMTETGKSSEIFASHRGVVQLNEFAPKSVPLKSNVGPFKNEAALLISLVS